MNQHNKLKMFMFNAISKKKTEPIWCDYLESDGTQVMDVISTNTYSTEKLSIKTRIKWTTPFPDKRQAMGQSGGVSGKYFEIRPNTKGTVVYAEGAVYSNIEPSKDKFDDVLFEITRTSTSNVLSGDLYVNDVLAARREYNGSYPYSFSIFGLSEFGTSLNCICQMGTVQIYHQETLVRNLRPCLNPKNMQPAMYDTVEGKYYYKKDGNDFKYQISFDTLDYIETDGNQYIDTGYIAGGGTDIELTISDIKHSGDMFNTLYSGSQQTKPRFDMYFSSETYVDRPGEILIETQYNNKASDAYTSVISYDTPKKLKVHQVKNELYLNDVYTTKVPTNIEKFKCDYTLAIFKDKRYTYRGLGAKLYYCVIKEDTIIVRDMIPVKKKDGTICMYDFISGNFYENSGTGTLIGA